MSLPATALGAASDVLHLAGEAVEALGILTATVIASRLPADPGPEPPHLVLVHRAPADGGQALSDSSSTGM